MSLLKNKIAVAAIVIAMAGGTVGLLSTPTHQTMATKYQTLYSKPAIPSTSNKVITNNELRPNEYAMYLAEGSTGQMVTYLQYGLYINGDGINGIDGDYGPNTVSAVENFQRTNGLSQDGVVGPQTWRKMEDTVLSIQYRLQAKGQSIQADGIAGPNTLNAIENVQREHGLNPDGIVTGATYNLLFDLWQ